MIPLTKSHLRNLRRLLVVAAPGLAASFTLQHVAGPGPLVMVGQFALGCAAAVVWVEWATLQQRRRRKRFRRLLAVDVNPAEVSPTVAGQPADEDLLYLRLKGARERLCAAQVILSSPIQRRQLQEAIDFIDRVGLTVPQWSDRDLPPMPDGA